MSNPGCDFLSFRLLLGLETEGSQQAHDNANGKQQSPDDAPAHELAPASRNPACLRERVVQRDRLDRWSSWLTSE